MEVRHWGLGIGDWTRGAGVWKPIDRNRCPATGDGRSGAGALGRGLADEDAGEHFLNMGAVGVDAVPGNLERRHHAIAHPDVDEKPREDLGAELVGDAMGFLSPFEFNHEEGVDAGDVVVDRFLDLLIFNLGDRLQKDAVGIAPGGRDHGVVADETAETLGGVVRSDEILLPLVEGLLAGAFDERDEEVAFGLEVTVDDRLGHASGARQLGGRRAGIAMLSEEFGGAVEQLLAALGCGQAAHGLVGPVGIEG